MSDSLTRRFQKLKKQATQYNNKLAELKGAEKEMLARLKEEFGCETYQDGLDLLSKLEKEAEAHERKLSKLLDQFETKWGDLLEKD